MFEKKRGKRFLASVMALVMLLSLAPVGALAADGETLTNEECSTVNQPAVEGGNQQAGADEDNNTPTPQPAKDPKPVESSSEADILPEGDLFDQAFGVNHGTSNSNDIAEHKGGNEGDREPVTTDSTPKYVIRFYVSQTGTENSYTEENKYTVANQPDSNKEEDTLELSVSPGYAILTDYNDVATGIDWQNFTQVNVTGDEAVKEWLNQYASKRVPTGLTNPATVNEIVEQVNKQYQENNKEYDLPQLTENYFNGFEFVEAKYVGSGESSIHVHVKLIRKPEYVTRTVRYMANDGTNREDRDSDFYEENTTATATVKDNMFTRAGYEFTGWNTQANGTGDSYSSGNSITIAGEEVTLYAQWTPQTYRINYELYSGTNAQINPTGYTYGEGVSSFAPATKDNYNFEGWYSEPEFENKVESISTTDTGDKTLYAHWTEEPATKPATTDVYVYFKIVDAAGKNISKNKINNKNLKKTVYNKEAGGATWATLGKIALTGDITEGALTNAGEAAQVQLKNAGNLWRENKDIAQTVLANVQWFQLKQCAGATDYVPDGSRWHLDGKITGYTVTYNKGTTDSVDKMPVADEVVYYLSVSDYTVSDAIPTRTGYVFTGWKSNIENNTTIYNAKGKFEMPAKNVVLTAQWEKDELVDPSVDKPEGITKGDGIADKYQIQVSFKAMNGTFKDGENSITEYTTVVTKYTSGEPSENGTAKLANQHLKAEKPDAGFTGPGSWKKGTDACEKPKADDSVQNGDHFVVTFEQEKESVANPIHYTINQHFIDAQKADKIKSTPKQATEVKTFGDSIPEEMLAVKQDFGDPKQNYVYVPAETTYKVGNQKKETTDNLANGAVIDLYYYLDVIGGKDEKGNLIDKGDEIPDCYQVTIIYKSSDESRGKISDASLKKEVLTIEDEEGNRLSSGKVEITGASAEVTGSKCYFVNWTNKDNTQVGTKATLKAQTIENAKGGDVYTFTANFDRSSGGSSRPSTPTVTIPDDVPTGLNGTDHYAYIIGYGNNDVRPQNNITRAEVATIFFRLLTDETRTANMTKSNSYNDVKDGDWFCCAVSTLSKMGIIKGYEDGSFKPNAPISRAEFAAIAARFDPDGDKTPATFADVTSHWAKDEISIAANHGWIKGYEDGSFKPDQKITRAETMTLVNRVLNRLPETKDDLHKDMKTWVDNMDETAWYYLAVQEATNSHYFKNKTSTKFEQWTDLRDTRDWSELEK